MVSHVFDLGMYIFIPSSSTPAFSFPFTMAQLPKLSESKLTWRTIKGSLFAIAIYTATENFKRTSPFADMLPARGDFFSHPIDSFSHLGHVIRLHEAHKSAEISARRQRAIDDVAKRTMYRKAHGLPEEQGIAGFIKLKEPERIASMSRGVLEPEVTASAAKAEPQQEEQQ